MTTTDTYPEALAVAPSAYPAATGANRDGGSMILDARRSEHEPDSGISEAAREARNITLQSGAGAPGAGGQPGDFAFIFGDGTECLRLKVDGRCFVRGQLVEHNLEAWQMFREWLMQASIALRR